VASNRVQVDTRAPLAKVWAVVRNIGALHTELVPGFVIDTQVELDGSARLVTFAHGTKLREPIITIDDEMKRLAWSADSPNFRHYNSSVDVIDLGNGMTRVVWTSDFLPETLAPQMRSAMAAGAKAMQAALDRLAS
jgi:hypothetical protein